MTPIQVLKDVFGYDSFRGEQEAAIETVLQKKHALVLMPTGMGKSVCYQVPAKILPGLTVVISPLIALMKDQVDAALAKGFRCCFINSSLDRREREERYQKLKAKEYELVYVTPERFRKSEFLEALGENEISLLAIDEAHCISEWGHDFRPDYTRIAEFREKMGHPLTMALTATATPEVQKDIIKQAGLEESEVELFHGGLQRPNLSVSVQEVVGLDEKIRAFIGHRHFHPGAMIVYFSLIDTLQKFSNEISRMGIEHWTYHGRMDPKQRKRAQEKFIKSENGLILATPAFGLGVDKENVRSVVHAEIPGAIEAYYQEIGRAGRDGKEAHCLLLYDGDDIAIQMDFMKWANPEPRFIRSIYNLLGTRRDTIKAEGLDDLRTQMNFYNRRDFRVETALNLLERWDSISGDVARGNYELHGEPPEEFLDQELYEKRLKGQQQKLFQLMQLLKESECRKREIHRYFGMDDDELCGRCDVCQKEKS